MTAPNFRSGVAHKRNGKLIYKGIFAGSPSPYLVLTPDLVTVNANDAFLAIANMSPDELLNRNIFEVFPPNPNDLAAQGTQRLLDSFERSRQQSDSLFLRYDVCRNGVWERRHWLTTNWPITDDDGSVIAIIHHTAEVPGQAANLLDQTGRLLDTATSVADNLQEVVERLTRGK